MKKKPSPKLQARNGSWARRAAKSHLLITDRSRKVAGQLNAGVKGLIDDVPVELVPQFARELREYLKSNKPDYITKVQTDKVLAGQQLPAGD